MEFEKFKYGGISHKPKASIRKSGMFGLNFALIKKYKIKDFKYVVFYYDKKRKVIGLKFTNDENEEGKLKMSIGEKSTSFSGKAFLDYYNINYKTLKRYEVEWDKDREMILIEL